MKILVILAIGSLVGLAYGFDIVTRAIKPEVNVVSVDLEDDCQELTDSSDGGKYGFCSRALVADALGPPCQPEQYREVVTDLADISNVPATTEVFPAVEPYLKKKVAPHVSYCPERCYTFQPLSAMDSTGTWWNVIQTSWFKQSITRCKCPQKYCSGSYGYCYPNQYWRGRCVQEISYVKLWVYNKFQCTWRWFKTDRGCCCIPYRYHPYQEQ